MMILGLTIACIVVAGTSMTFAAMRLVAERDKPQLNAADLVRPIVITESEEKPEASSMEVALAKINAQGGSLLSSLGITPSTNSSSSGA